jgi:hypothetical protein
MVGIDVKEPKVECEDPNCPFHGTLPVRGQILEGIVTSDKAERTIVSTKGMKSENQRSALTNPTV